MENHLTPYQSVITEIKSIISSGQEAAYSASSKAMLLTYWNIGKRIVEQELGGSERAEYGRGLISALAEDLTKVKIIPKGTCIITSNFISVFPMSRL